MLGFIRGHAIAPGASFAAEVDFSPPGVGQANGQLRVESNAASSRRSGLELRAWSKRLEREAAHLDERRSPASW